MSLSRQADADVRDADMFGFADALEELNSFHDSLDEEWWHAVDDDSDFWQLIPDEETAERVCYDDLYIDLGGEG